MKPSEPGPFFYHDASNVNNYIESRAGLNGALLVEQLCMFLSAGASVLELGMGPGTDLLLLSKYFDAVGSDYSEEFLESFRQKHKGIVVIRLDARDISVTLRFDCVFSNKVLHHLSTEELRESLRQQSVLVGPGGIVFHSFWLGDGESKAGGLRFAKYLPEAMDALFSDFGEVIMIKEFEELKPADSFFVVARM